MQDWLIAGEVYFLGFVIALLMAVVIKVMLFIIRKTSKKPSAASEVVKEGEVE
ncbi:MAG: hypothetical protein LBN36_00480 [Clostridiales Family XIII bacterium]|jgi:hypothetical protein|nr:hypothetical protein [Clostridiales Family XIII bacterium]